MSSFDMRSSTCVGSKAEPDKLFLVELEVVSIGRLRPLSSKVASVVSPVLAPTLFFVGSSEIVRSEARRFLHGRSSSFVSRKRM